MDRLMIRAPRSISADDDMALYGPARRLTAVFIALTIFILLGRSLRSVDSQLTETPAEDAPPFAAQPPDEPAVVDVDELQHAVTLPLPPESSDTIGIAGDTGSQRDADLCKNRFTTRFLEDFRSHRTQYCSADSMTNLTCFHGVNSGALTLGKNDRVDSLCLAEGQNAFDVDKRKFILDCSIRDLAEHEIAAGAVSYDEINSYQYLTGPKYLLNEWMSLQGQGQVESLKPSHERSFVILMKREVHENMWHCLNEIMAIMTTLLVLRISPSSPASTEALFNPGDVSNTEIIILDEHPDGPFFELFQMFSSKKPMRLEEWIASRVGRLEGKQDPPRVIPVDNIIIPYPGAANPLWSDWIPIDCSNNQMLPVFVESIFDFYKLNRARDRLASDFSLLPPRTLRLNVTFVNRKGSRRLMGLESHLFESAKARFSDNVNLRLINFEDMPFKEQIQIARDTDVLVGMHGAGLTHFMFMEEGRGAVVEIQPDRLCFKGFRNLAKMTRTAHFVAGASKVVGHCYPGAGGELEMMLEDGTAMPHETSRCWSYTTNPEEWSFSCTDPEVTGGEKSYMICESQTSDEWYQTCTKKEAADMWWLTRYVMEEERFLKLVEDAIEEVRRRQAPRHKA